MNQNTNQIHLEIKEIFDRLMADTDSEETASKFPAAKVEMTNVQTVMPLDEIEKAFVHTRVHEYKDGVCYFLHPNLSTADLRRLYPKIPQRELQLDLQISERHNNTSFIGISSLGNYVESPIIKNRNGPRNFRPEELEMMRDCWTQELIDTVLNLDMAMVRDLVDHFYSATGRYLFIPEFLNDLNKLRTSWDKLSKREQPPLPISLRKQTFQATGFLLNTPSAKCRRFYEKAYELSRQWRIQKITAWHLFELDAVCFGRKLQRNEMYQALGFSNEIPEAFPLKTNMPFAKKLRQSESRRRIQSKLQRDDGHALTYLHMMRIYHWEMVLKGRYQGSTRPPAFSTLCDQLIAELVDLSAERLKKLKGWMSQLRRGKIASLKGRK